MGALDRNMKDQLIEQLRRILHATGIPVIYVTHDQEEAFGIGDRLILLHDGVIVQDGPPIQVYNRPANRWAASFLGLTNFLTGKLISVDPLRVETPQGIFTSSTPACGTPVIGQEITILLRPFGPQVSERVDGENILKGIVQDVLFRSHGYQVEIQFAGAGPHHFGLDAAPPKGSEVSIDIPPEAVLCLEG